ncbi:matrixin family metalloprotease [Ideonella sp.]|uniref:matrixin family metalloprotease n=1 Tax=Ideonella sp. TaxID=1929293 RepID=UPI0035AEFBE6
MNTIDKTSARRGLRKAAAALGLLAMTASAANAATWLECEGNKIKWNNNWTNMYISTTSFPAGSTWDSDLQNAMWHWNNVKGAGFNFYVGRDTDGSHSKDNGTNEIYMHGTEVGSALAVTFSRYHCYWLFGYQYGRDEADIAFNSNLGWNTGKLNYASLGSPYNFELVALHELGHALGLGHSDGVQATMNSYYANGGPLGNNKEVDPLPDDRSGVRALYPDGTTEADVASSPFKRTGTGTTGLVSSPTSAARGSSVNIGYTFANLGTATATFNIGFYLSTNNIISTGDRLLGSNTGAWASAGALGTYTRTLTIPADVAPGTYYLGFLVDKDSGIAEANEGNNGQPMPRSITIY